MSRFLRFFRVFAVIIACAFSAFSAQAVINVCDEWSDIVGANCGRFSSDNACAPTSFQTLNDNTSLTVLPYRAGSGYGGHWTGANCSGTQILTHEGVWTGANFTNGNIYACWVPLVDRWYGTLHKKVVVLSDNGGGSVGDFWGGLTPYSYTTNDAYYGGSYPYREIRVENRGDWMWLAHFTNPSPGVTEWQICYDGAACATNTTGFSSSSLPVRPGYDFTGFYMYDGTEVFQSSGYIAQPLNILWDELPDYSEIYAHWVFSGNNGGNDLIVTLDDQGAKYPSSPHSFVYDSTFHLTTTPYKPGYGYAGHWTGPNCSGQQVLTHEGGPLPIRDSGEVTLYACWVPLTRPSRLGGDVKIFVLDDNAYGVTSGNFWSNHAPYSYYETDNNYGYAGSRTIKIENRGDWVYLNRIQSSGGTTYFRWAALTSANGVTVAGGGFYPPRQLPTRRGFNFTGYNSQAAGGGTEFFDADGNMAMNFSNLWNNSSAGYNTLYAQWQRGIYAVQLDAGVCSNGVGQYGVEPCRVYEKYGLGWYTDSAASNMISQLTEPPQRSGLSFKGYYIAPDGVGQIIDEFGYFGGASFITSGDYDNPTILYSDWDNNAIETWATLTIYDRGASSSSSPAPLFSQVNGDCVGKYRSSMSCNAQVVYMITVPRKNGWVYGGHYTGIGGTGDLFINSGGILQNTGVTQDTSVYANWYFGISYMPGVGANGSQTSGPTTCISESGCFAPEPTFTEPNGKIFGGWDCKLVVNNQVSSNSCAQSIYWAGQALSGATSGFLIDNITGIQLTATWVDDPQVYNKITLSSGNSQQTGAVAGITIGNQTVGGSGLIDGIEANQFIYEMENIGWFDQTYNPLMPGVSIFDQVPGLNAPTAPEGKRFDGYYDSHNNQVINGVGIIVGDPVYSEDTTLTARFVDQIRLELNPRGGTWGDCSVRYIYVTPDDVLESPLSCGPSYTGYDFVGYFDSNERLQYYDQNLIATLAVVPALSELPIDDGLDARWVAHKYKVDYYCDETLRLHNLVEFDSSYQVWNGLRDVEIESRCVNTPAVSGINGAGLKLVGWADQPGSSTVDFFINANIEHWGYAEDMRLHSVYKPIYYVGLNHVGSDYQASIPLNNTPSPNEFYYSNGLWYTDSTAQIRAQHVDTIPVKYGYDFTGYYLYRNGRWEPIINQNGVFLPSLNTGDVIVDNITQLEARWTVNQYNVRFNPNFDNGAQGTTDGTEEVSYNADEGWFIDNNGQHQQMLSITKPTWEGHVFGGYWTHSGGNTNSDNIMVVDADGTLLVNDQQLKQMFAMGDIPDEGELYAYWMPAQTIYLDFVCGSGVPENEIVHTISIQWGDTVTFPENEWCSKNGHSFVGWGFDAHPLAGNFEPGDTYEFLIDLQGENHTVVFASYEPVLGLTITTTAMPANTEFKFYLRAAGNFWIDWGDGGPREHITRSNASSETLYTHMYSTPVQFPGQRFIRFYGGGVDSTGGDTGGGQPVIRFGHNTIPGQNFPNESTPQYVYRATGNLGSLFPGVPSFYGTFMNCEKLVSVGPLFKGISHANFRSTFEGCTNLKTIPDDLFQGILGGQLTFYETFKDSGLESIPAGLFDTVVDTAMGEFEGTFSGCLSLRGQIPDGLFGNLSGAVHGSMFLRTFHNCYGLTGSIPANLFGNLSGVEGRAFEGTFEYCSGLSGPIPSRLFGSLGTNYAAYDMFKRTFYGCSGLTGPIPDDLFPNIIGCNGNDSFVETFYNCQGLTGFVPTAFADVLGSCGSSMTHIFQNSGLIQSCAAGTHSPYYPTNTYVQPQHYQQYISGGESYWDGRVSCERAKYQVALNKNHTDTTYTDPITGLYEQYNIGWSMTENGSYTNDLTLTQAQLPTRANYTFVGYYDHATNEDNIMIDAGGHVVASATALADNNSTWYAHWEPSNGPFVVTFRCEEGGAAISGYSYTNVTYNSSINVPTAGSCTKTGYTFSNWKILTSNTLFANTNSTYQWAHHFGSDVVPDWQPVTTTITLDQTGATTNGTTTLYTVYGRGAYLNPERVLGTEMTPQQNPINPPVKRATVSFDNNHNNGGGNVAYTVTLPFNGYYDAQTDGTKTIYGVGDNANYITTAGATAAADYTNGYNDPQTWYVRWGATTLLAAGIDFPADPMRNDGYIFDGWWTEAQGGTRVDESTSITGDVTWYAHWTRCGATPNSMTNVDTFTVSSSNNQCVYNITCDVCDGTSTRGCYTRFGEYGGTGDPYSFNIINTQTTGKLRESDNSFVGCHARKYHIYYDNMPANAIMPTSGLPDWYRYGTGESITGAPSWENGNAFLGWCTDDTLQNCVTLETAQTQGYYYQIGTGEYGTKTYYANTGCATGYTTYPYAIYGQAEFGGVVGTYQPNTCSPIHYHVNCHSNCPSDVPNCKACLEDFYFPVTGSGVHYHFGGAYNVYTFVGNDFTGSSSAYVPVSSNLPASTNVFAQSPDYYYWPLTVGIGVNSGSPLLGEIMNDTPEHNYVNFMNSLAGYNSASFGAGQHYTFGGLYTNGGIEYIPASGDVEWTISQSFQNFFWENNVEPTSTNNGQYFFDVYAHWIPKEYTINPLGSRG